jgi:hypothetical protein
MRSDVGYSVAAMIAARGENHGVLDADKKLQAVQESTTRQWRAMLIVFWTLLVTTLILGIAFIGRLAETFLPVTRPPQVVLSVLAVMTGTLMVLSFWQTTRYEKLRASRKQLEEAQAIAKELQETHPEILAARRLDQLLNEVQAGERGVGNFWRGVGVNTFFTVFGTVLGIILTLVAQYFGWLR